MFAENSETPLMAQKSGCNSTIYVQLSTGEYVVAVTGNSSIGIATSSVTVTVEGEHVLVQ